MILTPAKKKNKNKTVNYNSNVPNSTTKLYLEGPGDREYLAATFAAGPIEFPGMECSEVSSLSLL